MKPGTKLLNAAIVLAIAGVSLVVLVLPDAIPEPLALFRGGGPNPMPSNAPLLLLVGIVFLATAGALLALKRITRAR